MTGVRALYLTSVEAESGKSVVALGLMETLTRSVSRVGYFRPVIRAGAEADKRIELFRTRYRLDQSYDESFGITSDETRDFGGNHVDPALVSRIIERFRRLANRCDFVLVEGTDHLSASKAFEFALNAEIASNLGAVALIVLTAQDHAPAQVNGALTVGENIGDLGGLTIGHRAYVISQNDAASPDARRRLFMNWSYCWRTKRRKEQELQYLTIDPHSPPEFRANIVRNLDEFHEVFGTVEGDGLWLDPAERVRIW